jgi:hypothetical protein
MLQIKTVRPACLALLEELMHVEELKSFRLAGGTALSLILGHRISIDLDLFTNRLFEVGEFTTFLKRHFGDRVLIHGTNRYGVFANIDDIKVDFLYRYEKFINDENVIQDIRLASLEDIAAMKIFATANRASKKDYYDLFELLNVYTFAQLIAFYVKMYTNYEVASLIKSLSGFEENDLEREPETLRQVTWETVKSRVSEEIRNYVHALQQEQVKAEAERDETIKKLIDRKKK